MGYPEKHPQKPAEQAGREVPGPGNRGLKQPRIAIFKGHVSDRVTSGDQISHYGKRANLISLSIIRANPGPFRSHLAYFLLCRLVRDTRVSNQLGGPKKNTPHHNH